MASDKGRCILFASFRLKEDASETICELQTVYIDTRNSAKEFDLKDGTRAGQFEKFGDRELQQLLQNSARTRKELAAQLRSYSSYLFFIRFEESKKLICTPNKSSRASRRNFFLPLRRHDKDSTVKTIGIRLGRESESSIYRSRSRVCIDCRGNYRSD